MEASSTQTINKKPWYKSWWGVLILIAFLPFTLSYIVWKQQWKLPVKLGIIAVIWIVFAGMGSSKKNDNTSPQTQQSTTITTSPKAKPEKVEFTLEQKQSDFKNFYLDFYSQGQMITTAQKKVIKVANLINNREELYLAYDSLKSQQQSLAQKTLDLKVPQSLQEYSQMNSALFDLSMASKKFENAISKFQDYLNKGDLKILSEIKTESDNGVTSLNTSMEKIEEVAKQLNIDVSDPSKITASTGSKEQLAGQKVPFELVESSATLTNVQGHNRTVVISPDNINENDLNILGDELKAYSKDDKFTWIQVFSDKRAATEVRVKAQNEDPSLSNADLDFYEKSFVGQYIKSGDIHTFTYCLNGYFLDSCKDKTQQRVIKY